MNHTNGKIAEESKLRLMNALLVVMKQYEFKDITVTQIAQEAELSRKTFYRLFSEKQEVIELYFGKLYQECIGQIKKQQIHHYWDLVQLYFDYWQTKKEKLLLLRENNLLTQLFTYIYQHSQEVFTIVRSDEIKNNFSDELPYLLAYGVGGMHCMLLKWVEEGMAVPSNELIDKLKTGFQSFEI